MKIINGTLLHQPTFGAIYRLKTIPEANPKGSWPGQSIDFLDFIQEQATFDVCAEFYKQAKDSDIFSKVDHEEEKSVSPSEPVAREKKQSEDVPF